MPGGLRLRTMAFVVGLAAAGAATTTSSHARAAPQTARGEGAAAPVDATAAINVAAARRHYEQARTDYERGAYREAITELEAGYALDPNKYLVFNLGVVHEKLGDIEDAVKWFRLYTIMDITPQERDRAESYLRRLEGAKKEVEAKQAARDRLERQQIQQQQDASRKAATAARTAAAATPAKSATRIHGRLDAITAAGASITVAALSFGLIMGWKAFADTPHGTPVTGRNNLTYTSLFNQHDGAYREAVVADIGLATAIAAGAATATLYFARTRPASRAATGKATVGVAPLSSGGGLFVQGSF